jgi:pimeloyl-ACP methyl ester carboxylesterase
MVAPLATVIITQELPLEENGGCATPDTLSIDNNLSERHASRRRQLVNWKGDLDRRWVIVNGRPLFYRLRPASVSPAEVPIILLHGFAISGRYLEPLAKSLPDDYPVFVPDLPGSGRSHPAPTTITIESLADEAIAFMDACGIEKAVMLGNSLGCSFISEIAHRYPDRIVAAVMVSPVGGRHNRPLPKSLVQLALDALREPPLIVPIAIWDYVRFGLRRTVSLFRSMHHYQAFELIAEVSVPMMVVIGGRDPLVSDEEIRETFAPHARCQIVRIDAATHAINFSAPAELARLVTCFLEKGSVSDETVINDFATVMA